MYYRNSEGYWNPTEGLALAAVTRWEKQKRRNAASENRSRKSGSRRDRTSRVRSIGNEPRVSVCRVGA